MMLIDGKKLASEILDKLRPRLAALKLKPVFVDIVVGNDPVVWSYVKTKGRAAQQLGVSFKIREFPNETSTDQVSTAIAEINADPSVCGLIVQLPVPAHIDRKDVLDAIDPEIDVDCLGRSNSELFYGGKARLQPPTAAAILHVLDTLPVPWQDRKILVVGQGSLVGKPVTFLLQQRGCTVEVADRQTKDLSEKTKQAEIIVSCAGSPSLITGDMVRPGAIVIDAGTAEWDNTIAGDVDLDSVSDKAAYVSPVPGGVGPVTVAKLLENVVIVAERKLT